MRPTTMPTTTIVMSCGAATVRAETVLPVTGLLVFTLKRGLVVACSLVISPFRVRHKDADAVVCISCETPHLQDYDAFIIRLLSSSSPLGCWLPKRGCPRGRSHHRIPQPSCNAAGLRIRRFTISILETGSWLNYLAGTQTARTQTASGRREGHQEEGEPR